MEKDKDKILKFQKQLNKKIKPNADDAAFIPTLDRWSKRYFIVLFSQMFLCAVSCFLALIFWNDPSMADQSRIVYILEGMFLVTPIFMPAIFLLHYSGRNTTMSSVA